MHMQITLECTTILRAQAQNTLQAELTV